MKNTKKMGNWTCKTQYHGKQLALQYKEGKKPKTIIIKKAQKTKKKYSLPKKLSFKRMFPGFF